MIAPLIIFDLDGTLAESKQAITSEVAHLLARLLDKTRVAVISGGALSQFLSQIVAQLPSDANFKNLYLLPTSGAALYEYHLSTSLESARDKLLKANASAWEKIYEKHLSEADEHTIEAAMREAIIETGVIDLSIPPHGERIEYRGNQVTLSALGQQAPLAEKKVWDPNREKRDALRASIARRLPDFLVEIGGMTSIDVTKRGIDKAYGLHKLCEHLDIKESDALYVGDELGEGGNDETVHKTDTQTRSVKDPADTVPLIESFLASA